MNVADEIKKQAGTLKEKYHLSILGIFGSHARGEETGESDIDILVEFKPGHETFDNYMDLKLYLEDTYGVKVDLVTKEALRPELKDSILDEVTYA